MTQYESYQYESYRAHQPTVTVRLPQLEPALRFLEKQQDEHFDLVRRLCGTTAGQDSTPLFQVDIVLLSVLNRSLDLIDGFLATFDRWNLSTAAPQVRMQTYFIVEPGQAELAVALPPNPNLVVVHADDVGDAAVGPAVGRQEHDARPLGRPSLHCPRSHRGFEVGSITTPELQWSESHDNSKAHHCH
jgi:hypothetical protein